MTEVVIEDHYATLGLPRYAPIADVRRTYRQLAAATHPDRNPGHVTAFQQYTAAHEILADEESKERYDRQLRRAVVDVGDQDDTEETIERDRVKCQQQRRVPLSAYTPGDEVMKHMKEMVVNDTADSRRKFVEPCAPNNRLYVTSSAVEETLKVRAALDTEKTRVLEELERMHAEADRERERRRRERDEKRSNVSPPLLSLHPSVSNPVLRCETADRTDMLEEEASERDGLVKFFRKLPRVVIPSDSELAELQLKGVQGRAELEQWMNILKQKLDVVGHELSQTRR